MSISELAQRDAANSRCDRVETQHFLLALLGYPEAGAALAAQSVTRDGLLAAIARVIESGAREDRHFIKPERLAVAGERLLPSQQAEKAFLAPIHYLDLLGNRVHSGHCLLAVLSVADGIAVKALRAMGVDPDAICDGIIGHPS